MGDRVWFEVVWTFGGVEYLFATHATRSRAVADYRRGRARCWKLIHGGALRVDEVRRG